MADTKTMLRPDESRLVGAGVSSSVGFTADLTVRRIEDLVAHHLQFIGTDRTGWDKLYLDRSDERLWEMTYPESQMHGGGPPTLSVISANDASRKYSSIRPSNNRMDRDGEG
jgi:hypothetical protein